MWCSAPNFWKGGGLESRCVGRVCGAEGAVSLRVRLAINIRKSTSKCILKMRL